MNSQNIGKSKSFKEHLFYWAAGLLLLLLPLFLSDFRLNLMGKFLTFAIVAIGIDLIWGYTGILSLGHGVFFSLGAYAMAMYLKLGAEDLPDFMMWSGLLELPWFWKPFQYAWLALPMAVCIPMAFALLIGFSTFRAGVKGVYFSILTQALALVFSILFIGQQPYTGGTNGITNFQDIFGFSLSDSSTTTALYLVTVVILMSVFAVSRWLVGTKTGRLLVAIRDGENRLRFLGYSPATGEVARCHTGWRKPLEVSRLLPRGLQDGSFCPFRRTGGTCRSTLRPPGRDHFTFDDGDPSLRGDGHVGGGRW